MSGLVLNIERRTATARGIAVKLPRYQIIILLELYRGAPFFVTKQHLMSCFWEPGKYMPADPEKTMNVHVCKLRSILRPLGIGIMTERGQGYRLVELAQPQMSMPALTNSQTASCKVAVT